MSRHAEPVRTAAAPKSRHPRRPELEPAKPGRSLGAAAQLAAIRRTLAGGVLRQLETGGTPAGRSADPAVAKPAGRAANRTGLPDRLKAGLEALSGLAMDDVRVHRDSGKPAQLDAHAYAQGSDIHLAPGQERHLPHEAWHVVQQKQGRVKATRQPKGIGVNDDGRLEHEADLMGARAAQTRAETGATLDRRQGLAERLSDARRPSAPAAARRARAGGPQSGSAPVVQRKIKIRSGPVLTAKSELPRDVPRGRLAAMLRDPHFHLAQDLDAVRERANGRPAPILTPHRHLIGEQHNASHFREAVQAWGWGADKMKESYGQSTLVRDEVAERNRAPGRIYDSWFTGMKSLENLHPYMLTGFGMLKVRLEHLRTGTTTLRNNATSAIFNVAGAQAQFAQNAAIVAGFRNEVADAWSFVSIHMPSYEHACAQGNPQLNMLNFMTGNWDQMAADLKALTVQPYSAWYRWGSTHTALANQAQAITAFIAQYVDPWAQALIELTVQEVRATLGRRPPQRMRQAALTADWQRMDANPGTTPLELFSPARELFMVHLINTNLAVPGLVGMGEDHVAPVAAKVQSARAHASYGAFVTAISTP